MAAAPQLHVPQTSRFGRSAGRVERGEDRAGARHLITTGRGDIAHDKDLVRSHARDRETESRGCSAPTSNPRIHRTELRVEKVRDLLEGEVRDEDLTHLRDHHETL